MRTSALQDLYLQRPVTMTVIICIISVLPWIGMGDFSTKGEPREAAVAISMLDSGNGILPLSYADEFAYKPPMAHWLMAAFSYPQGYVSEFTSRLPSALAFIIMIGFVLVFFGKRISKFQVAFIATFILITCIEIHRAAMTARVDMLLTAFMVLGLLQLYHWEERLELKGLPVIIPLLLGCAILTKGPVGVILPLFVFGVYLLLLRKYRFLRICKALLYIFIPSLFLPLLWYFAAWKQGGEAFFDVVMAENFGRFFHLQSLDIKYNLGHENGVWYNFMTLIAGFTPWTIFFFFSLFGMKIRRPEKSFKDILKDTWQRILAMDKVRLFSLVALVCIVFFFSIPSSKRSVYLMPAYPFIALFLAEFTLYLTEYRRKVTRIFAAFLTSVVSVFVIALLLVMGGFIHPVAIASQYINEPETLHIIEVLTRQLTNPGILTIGILSVTIIVLLIVYYQMFKKINIKILYATIALMFCVNMLIDGVIMLSVRKAGSSRAFAERIRQEYPLDNKNVFVMNDLTQYSNMYGLNFYMGNIFHDFKDKQPASGYFLMTERDVEKIINKYGDKYTFRILTSTNYEKSEVGQKILLSEFTRKP